MSSPNLNNLIIVGCILVYIAGMLFGLKKEGDTMLCQVFPFLYKSQWYTEW